MEYNDRLFAFENMFGKGQLKIGIGEIFQASELSVIRGGEIRLHTQKCDEITYAISGSAEFTSGNNKHQVKAGQIHFIKSGLTHRIEASPEENFRYICIGFLPDMSAKASLAFYDAVGDSDYIVANDNGSIKVLSEFLIREFYNQDDHSAEMINSYISQIFVNIARILSTQEDVYTRNHSKKSGNYAMYKMLRYVDREYLQITSVSEISKALSYSEYYLSHLFKEKMGVTLKEYLTKKKIAYAAELLRTSDITVEQITDHLNFSCPRTFRRAFKQHTGMTPTEYKTSL